MLNRAAQGDDQVHRSMPAASKLPALRQWVVCAREVDYPVEVTEPIDWILWTSVETENIEDGCERLGWYSRRWGIEKSLFDLPFLLPCQLAKPRPSSRRNVP